MKRIVKYLVFTILAVAMLSGAAIAFAQGGAAGPGGPGGPGKPGRGVGGEVISIDGSTIHVENPREEATIVTTDSTEFVVNGEAGDLDDIEVGMFVHAEGERNDDDTFTATRVVASDEAPPPPPGGPGRGVGGEVTSIDGSTIHVENPHRETAIITTDSTEFVVNGEEGDLDDVEVGMFVHAEGERNDDDTFTATRVIASDEAPPPPPGGPGKDQK
jgi:hypothetical protein